MYSIEGKEIEKGSFVLGMGQMVTSKGQGGGALTNTKTGQIYGIYTGIASSVDEEGNLIGDEQG